MRLWDRWVPALVLAALATGCVDRAPEGFGQTPPGPGARVRYDLGHRPLPDVPLPNDTATWPDPTSRTGLRINASLIAPTAIERRARERFDELEGWGTFAPISVAFEPTGDERAALDLANLRARHRGDDYDFADDALYVVDLETGVPAVLDVGHGNFDYTMARTHRLGPHDPRGAERHLLLETVDETGGGEVTAYDPARDGDFDGVLDVPNLDAPFACPPPGSCQDPRDPSYDTTACVEARRERDRCVADRMMDFYERETDTLIVRPLLPLEPNRRYAVVLTDRLVDAGGHPVRSPFEQVFHASQRDTAVRVAEILDDPALSSYYGDLAGTGIERVAFVWRFTTQPVVDDLVALRDGLHGTGRHAELATDFPPALELQRSVGLISGLAEGATDPDGWVESAAGEEAGCPAIADNRFILEVDAVKDALPQVLNEGLGLSEGPETQLLLRKLDALSHLVIATYRAPFFLEGGPEGTDPSAAWDLSQRTADTVQVLLAVPEATEAHAQPFDVNLFGHGYTSSFLELMLYAGNMAERGLATVGINAVGHGLVLDEGEQALAGALLQGECLGPLADALTLGRARDLNGDGTADSGGDFWSSYLFHTRDVVRQSTLDHVQLVRILRAFGTAGGRMRCRDEGRSPAVVDCPSDVAGDFDDDGVADLGGPDARIGTWGESLGGILSGIHGALDPGVTSAVPGSGGGGLTDIGVRSIQGGVIEAVTLRLLGPFVAGVPASERSHCDDGLDPRCTLCEGDSVSLRWILPEVNDTGEVEIHCLAPSVLEDVTVRVLDTASGEVACARPDGEGRFQVGLPASEGHPVVVQMYDGLAVESFDGCQLVEGAELRFAVERWGPGPYREGDGNEAGTASCEAASCQQFAGRFYRLGDPLVAPGEGYGLKRQSPALRRFLALAQAALEPADPINYARHYGLRPLRRPDGRAGTPHASLTLDTIGDQNVPLDAGIAFARATGALPIFRPDQRERFPAYADWVTPAPLYDALGGRTPNRALIEGHVLEGVAALARHPAAPTCASSANAAPADATYLDLEGETRACYPSCEEGCYSGQICDESTGACVPEPLGKRTCEEALFDADDLDEGAHTYFEQTAPVPHRLARLATRVDDTGLETVWSPRLDGTPGADEGYEPAPSPNGRLLALLDAYTVPEGEHTFVNGNPCQAFDHGTYLANLVARFFASDGTDLYYLSHPASHRCLAEDACSD